MLTEWIPSCRSNGKGALVEFFLIPTFQRMTSLSMRCENKAATEAAARMPAAGEQASQDSAASVNYPAAANKNPATPNVAGARGHPRAASSFAASDAGGSPMDFDPELEVFY